MCTIQFRLTNYLLICINNLLANLFITENVFLRNIKLYSKHFVCFLKRIGVYVLNGQQVIS